MTQHWATPPDDLRLGEQEVHVWRLSLLDVPAGTLASLQEVLTAEEVARAQRFVFERDRVCSLVAHSVLRLLAGRYTQLAPALLRFTLNEYGKPALAGPGPGPVLHFNLSHSASLVLYAFAWQRHLGVDVEYMRTGIDYAELAAYCFSPFEQETLRSVGPDQRHQTFYNCWTRKEAYIKARGMGLSLPLALFDVSLRSGEEAALLASREDPNEVQRWSMCRLFPGPDYAGALAVEGTGWQLRCWRWPQW
ncbi:MAG TPA: 4'-phosphopantetheinyl transferase superfamily protein [Ktedonobacteraceae bacterium]|jgi:4'-phosphopantetheinyl transferase